MRLRFFIGLWAALTLSLITSCANVPRAEYQDAAEVPADAHPAPLIFTKISTRLPTGTEVGHISNRYFCLYPFMPVGRDAVDGIIIPRDVREAFADTMRGLGYDVAGGSEFLFDEEIEDDLIRAEYRVGARLMEVRMDTCEKEADFIAALSPSRFGTRGKMFIRLEWHIFDALKRQTVYRVTTDGFAERKVYNPEGLQLLFEEAFSMAAHNMAADPAFNALIVSGHKPPEAPKKQEERPRKFDPRENVALDESPLSTTPVPQHIEDIQKAVVMVQGGVGHGSGFFISRDGHIITNAHVVGDAQRVRITPHKQRAMTAEVLRKDKGRDIALLKLEAMPEGFKPATLPIREAWPNVSETVYALGAPQARGLKDTVTRGIISAHRKNFVMYNRRYDFLQSDVAVHGGNSGGPLVDEHGNLVAVTVAGMFMGLDKIDSGLNLFIPIEDALKTLAIGEHGAPYDPEKPSAIPGQDGEPVIIIP